MTVWTREEIKCAVCDGTGRTPRSSPRGRTVDLGCHNCGGSGVVIKEVAQKRPSVTHAPGNPAERRTPPRGRR